MYYFEKKDKIIVIHLKLNCIWSLPQGRFMPGWQNFFVRIEENSLGKKKSF